MGDLLTAFSWLIVYSTFCVCLKAAQRILVCTFSLTHRIKLHHCFIGTLLCLYVSIHLPTCLSIYHPLTYTHKKLGLWHDFLAAWPLNSALVTNISGCASCPSILYLLPLSPQRFGRNFILQRCSKRPLLLNDLWLQFSDRFPKWTQMYKIVNLIVSSSNFPPTCTQRASFFSFFYFHSSTQSYCVCKSSVGNARHCALAFHCLNSFLLLLNILTPAHVYIQRYLHLKTQILY